MKLPKTMKFGKNDFYSKVSGTVLMLIAIFILIGCGDQRMQTLKWTEYEPVYMTEQEFTNAVGMEKSRNLKNPGKIYLQSLSVHK
jgi:hypothetical protein